MVFNIFLLDIFQTHHFMSFIIANDVGTTARGMLRSIINNNVMNEFTMDGRQHRKPGGVVSIKKRPFKDTKCYAVMKSNPHILRNEYLLLQYFPLFQKPSTGEATSNSP
jgi:hypothetical protein